MYKGVLTGILRVAKESIFSGMNNLGVYSILSVKFSDKFGLTEKEVVSLLKYYNEENKIENVRNWYNGYIFGRNTIYNPWSIINYTANIADGEKSYWANTADNSLIKELVTDSPEGVKREIYDTGGRKEVERVYQAFILGLLVNLSIDYEVSSEKESGYGI